MAIKAEKSKQEAAAKEAFAVNDKLKEAFVTSDNRVFGRENPALNNQREIGGNEKEIAKFTRGEVKGVEARAEKIKEEHASVLADLEKEQKDHANAVEAAREALGLRAKGGK